MKQKQLLSLLFILINLLSTNLFSQKSEIGFHMGYGNTDITNSSSKFIFTKQKDFGQFYSVGFHYFHSLKGDILRFKSGLDHDRRIEDEKRLNYLRIPLGLDFTLGKRLQFVFGGGFYSSLLIAHSGFSWYSDFEETKNWFQVGAYYNLGLGFQITEKYHVSLMARKNIDISVIYKDIYEHHGGISREHIKGYDGYIDICLRYFFTSTTSKKLK